MRRSLFAPLVSRRLKRLEEEVAGLWRSEAGPRFYREWKRSGRHLEEYASELAGTAFALFCVVGVVSFLMAKSSPALASLPSAPAHLFLIGLLLGGAGWLVAISPPGRLSGAHINPAVSIGFLALGKMYARDTLGYVIAQMLGATIGVWLGTSAFGRLAREVGNATLHPGPGLGWMLTLAGETATTFALTLAIYTFVSHKRLARWTPAMATVLVGVLVWLDDDYSGCGMNPARWFGPALSVRYWEYAAAYALGPIFGALLAAGVRRSGLMGHPVPHTGKLYHDPSFRSLFKHDTLPSTPPHAAARAQSSDQ